MPIQCSVWTEGSYAEQTDNKMTDASGTYAGGVFFCAYSFIFYTFHEEVVETAFSVI